MKTYRFTITLAVLGLATLALAVAGVRTPLGVEGAIGFTAVLALLAVAATDYRIGERRFFSR